MRDRRTLAVAGITVLAVVAATIGIRSTSNSATASTAILSVISGDVLVRPAPGVPLRAGQDGEALKAGMAVEAKAPNGRAVLTFEDGSTVELEPGTSVGVDEVSTGTHGELVVRLRQDRGKTWSYIQPQISPNARFHIMTPTATAVVRGTAFEIVVEEVGANSAAVTRVTVFHGQVDMVAAGQVQPVTASHTAEVAEGGSPQELKQVTLPQRCLRMELLSSAMMTVTDPEGRSAGQTPLGAVSQIPQTTMTGPQEDPQLVDVFSPSAGDWEVGIVPRGEGGVFQLVVSTVVGMKPGTPTVLRGAIQAGQRLVTHIHVDDSGAADRFAAFQQSAQTKANIALARIGGTTTAPFPQAKVVAPAVDQLPPGCR